MFMEWPDRWNGHQEHTATTEIHKQQQLKYTNSNNWNTQTATTEIYKHQQLKYTNTNNWNILMVTQFNLLALKQGAMHNRSYIYITMDYADTFISSYLFLLHHGLHWDWYTVFLRGAIYENVWQRLKLHKPWVMQGQTESLYYSDHVLWAIMGLHHGLYMPGLFP